jgi:hypothetical protein
VCILASQCDKDSIIPCNRDIAGPDSSIRKGFTAVDLRVDEEYVCCSKQDVIPDEPLECYDIANHDCVDPSECLPNNVDLRSIDSEPVTGFCEKIEIPLLSSVSSLVLDPRSGDESELVCCDENNIAGRVKQPEIPMPKCRDFQGHRCVKSEMCKNPKILGENLDPSDAIDIRESSFVEEALTEDLCQNEKVCCEEPDIERPLPPTPKPKPSPKKPEPSTQIPVEPTTTPDVPFDIPPIAPKSNTK